MGGTTSKNVRKWPRETLCDHDGGINCMAASEDGSLLVTGSEDKTARLWELGGQETSCLGIMRGHSNYISCVTVMDTFILTGSADSTLRKWDTISCDCLFTYRGHESRISRLLCTGEYVLSASHDHTAKAWRVKDEDLEGLSDEKALIRTFEGHTAGVYSLVVDPGEEREKEMGYGDLVITGSLDCTARSYDFISGTFLKEFVGHTGCVVSMVTDPGARLLYTGSADKTIRTWDIDKGINYRLFEGHKHHITCLLPLSQLLYSGDGGGFVRAWDLTRRDYLKGGARNKVMNQDSLTSFRPATNTINSIKLHNGMLFVASGDNMARALDPATQSLVAVFSGHRIAVTCMAICGSRLYTGSTDTTLMVWDLPKLRALGEEPSSSEEEESEEDED
ncbi:WD repeat-containing protein 86-like [Eriocheir sinensis]|uniref:WD repeat-containing protein 86-like n=1 Tax=Eriocheir sinensis TaxID=95602 RepID=UPI0021C6F283|nr:WD repeat-containing protein 86-like [Eriocheir sinensis]